MRTRSSSNLIAESSTTPKRHNRRRSKQRVEPFSLEKSLVVTMADQHTMAELLQAPTEGYGDAIVIPAILAENFELKHGLLNLITSTIKYRDVPNSSIKLMLFPFSIEGAAQIWLEKEPPRSILTWEDLVFKFINKFFPPSKTTNLHNEITNFQQRFDKSFCEAWDRFKDLLRACPHNGFTELHQLDTFYNALTPTGQDSLNVAAGGNLLTKTPRDALTIIENKSKVHNSRNKPIVTKVSMNAPSSSTPDSPEIAALVDAVKAMLHQKSSPPVSVKAVEEICFTCGGPHPYHQFLAINGNVFLEYQDNIQGYVSAAAVNYNQGNTGYRPQSVANQIRPPRFTQPNVQNNQTRYNQGYNQNRGNNQGNPSYQTPIQQNQVAPSNELSNYKKINEANMKAMQNQINNVKNEMQTLIQTLMSNQTNELKNMMVSFLQMNTASSSGLGSLPSNTIANRRARTPVNEHYLAVILKKFPEKLGDLGKFLIPCDFLELVECLALADLGESINLIPLSIWKKLSLPKLTPTQMILELVDRSTTSPSVVDYVVDPRVPLILRRPFLRTARALIDVYGEELTLRVDDEAKPSKVWSSSRYSYNDAVSINRIDVIDVSCEEYAQEVLGFLDSSTSGNPTPSLDPILSTSSPSLTPFEEGDFILEEIEACLTNDSIPPGIDDDDFDPEGDLLLLEKLLNDDPSSPLPPKELHVEELKIVKSSIDDPPELELKDLPSHLEYAFLEGTDKLPVIIAKNLKEDEKVRLLKVLKSHKRAIAWKISDIKGIDPQFCTHKILMEDDSKLEIQHQRRVNPKIHEVSPVHCVPKKGGITVIENEDNELIPTRLVTGWRVCIDYRKLNDATRKDHFPLPFMDQMLERLAGNEYYCFLDGFSRYFQIPIDPQDQEKTTLTCPYGTFVYRRMPFGFCNAPGTFQRYIMAIFHDMIEETMEISKFEIKVDKAKVDVIAKLPHPTSVKGIRSFLGHVGFYRRFIQDFSKIARPMTHLLEKNTPFIFSKECVESFNILKKKLTEASILVAPDWDLPFKILCDASDYAVGAVLGQHKTKHFQPIYYASKTMTDAQSYYTMTEKELLAVVYAFEKFWAYLVLSKTIVYTDHSALKYLLAKQDAKPILLRWILLLQEFDVIIRDKKGAENLAADHLSRLENPHQDVLEYKEITKIFPLETLGPFPSSLGNKYILVAVDYLSKWVEAKALPTNDARVVVMLKYGVTHRLSTAYHPQMSGQVEVSNRGLKRILERTVGKNCASWSDKLDDALWAFCTAFKTPIECTPYKLVYGKACHIPIELEHKAYWALKHCNFDLKTAGDHRKVQMNDLNEIRDQAYENSLIYKEKTKKIHDSKIKNRVFKVGDRVLLFNSRLKIFSGKLKTRWTRPFTVTQVIPYGTVKLSQTDRLNFKVNGHRLKHYFGGDIPPMVAPDLQTFPIDN
ncbi:reverse transcriptase domain-containing protein [Tanacetum coccineum]